MPFILTKGRGAIDPDTNSQMVITGGPQIEWNEAKFESPSISLNILIGLREKFSDRPIATNDPRNPCVMIQAGQFDKAFRARNMSDVESNTRLVEYLVRMIAFINKHYPLANAPFLWSDYDKIAVSRQLVYRMPSDERLLELSVHPE